VLTALITYRPTVDYKYPINDISLSLIDIRMTLRLSSNIADRLATVSQKKNVTLV